MGGVNYDYNGSFENVRQNLRISKEQFDILDKLDGKQDGQITESIFKLALDMRIKKQGAESNIKPEWQKQDEDVKKALHAVLDNDYTDWEKPQKMQFKNLKVKTTKELPEDVQKCLQQYVKDLLRVYQTTGKFDKTSVSTMVPANMKLRVSNFSGLKYKEEKNDKNDYTEKHGNEVVHHKVPDGIVIAVEYDWADPQTGKNYSGFVILNADTVK